MIKEKTNKKIFSISKKIMLSIISANVFIVIIVIGVMFFLLNAKVANESKDFAISQVESNVNTFEQKFSNIESAVGTLVNIVKSKTDVNLAKTDSEYLQNLKRELTPELIAIGEGTDLTTSIYIYYNVKLFNQEADIWVLDDGNKKFTLQDSFGMEYYKDYNSWYNDPIDDQKTLWTFPYESEAGGLITSYVTPVIKNGETIALVGMDLYLNAISEELQSIKLFDTGYLYLMDAEGNIIYHPKSEFGSNMKDSGDYQFLLDDMAKEETGFTSYKRDDGTTVISAFSHLNNGWVVASSIPEKEVLKIINSVILVLLGIGFAMVFVSMIIGKIVGNSISKPILEVVSATDRIKNGDFTVTVDIKTSDETRLLANGLNEMTSSVRSLINENHKVSKEMLDAASNLAAMSEETTATIEQVAKTIEEITSGTQDTAKDAESGAIIASDIDTKFNVLIENSELMKKNANDAIDMNKLGLKVLKTLKERSESSKKSNEKVTVAIKNLDIRVADITNIISTISSIAEQTNLLALNASIEAARAGDAGRGFAVVADEIRKLAENSGKATDEIKGIVTAIQFESKDTVDVMEEVSIISKEQNVAVSDVSDALAKIFSSVDNITNQIDSVTSELNGLAGSKNDLVELVNNISAVSEETAAATEEVNASMVEQTRAVEQVAESAERLNELSNDLNKQIEVFKIN